MRLIFLCPNSAFSKDSLFIVYKLHMSYRNGKVNEGQVFCALDKFCFNLSRLFTFYYYESERLA